MKKIFIGAVFAILLVSLLMPTLLHAQNEPAGVVQAFIAAFNTYDADATTKLVTDDFELKIIYGTPDDPVVQGKEGLTEMLGGVKADEFQLSVADLKTDGARVTGTYSGEGKDIRSVGVGPEVGTIEAVVENGLLKSIVFTVDPEYNKRYEAAVAAKEKLPQTGADMRMSSVGIFVLAFVLLVLGAALMLKNKMRV